MGYWYEYDSLGTHTKTTIYNYGSPFFHIYPLKEKKIVVSNSGIVKMDYYDTNFYTIQRSKKATNLLLEFPESAHINSWCLYYTPGKIICGSKNGYYIQISTNAITCTKSSDLPTHKRYLDISNLKNGIYYVYHLGISYYETTIVLE